MGADRIYIAASKASESGSGFGFAAAALSAERGAGNTLRIPFPNTGSGCLLLLESLILALNRRIPLKDAAAKVRSCDTRAWRTVEPEPCVSTPPGANEAPQQKGFAFRYDLETVFTLQRESELPGANGKGEAGAPAAGRPRLCMEFAVALLEVVRTMVADAVSGGGDPIGEGICGKVSAEAGTRYFSQSRAPPRDRARQGPYREERTGAEQTLRPPLLFRQPRVVQKERLT